MTYRKTDDAVRKLTPEQYRVTSKTAPNAPSPGSIMTTRSRVSMSTSYRRTTCSPRPTNSIRLRLAEFHQADRTGNVNELRDNSHGMIRTEVRSVHGDTISAMCFPTVQKTRVGCDTASIPPHSGSFPARKWRPRATAPISTR